MSYSCAQCPYAAQFESGLKMHQQLYHENKSELFKEKSGTVPRSKDDAEPSFGTARETGTRLLPTRTSSATRLLGRLRARICRSRQLTTHEEEVSAAHGPDLTAISDCTSNPLKAESVMSVASVKEPLVYSCHLCQFDADRITVLDRHLLNDHKVGLESLLKLVMAKTKDGLSDNGTPQTYSIRQPYYKGQNEILHEEGDFVIETVTPQIKILRHASTNTDLRWQEIPNVKECQEFTEELQKMMTSPIKSTDEEFMSKMQCLNEYMNRFLSSSNHLKRLTKEYDSRYNVRENKNEPYFNLELENTRSPESTSEWERAHSEKVVRQKTPAQPNVRPRSDRARFSSDSYYF